MFVPGPNSYTQRWGEKPDIIQKEKMQLHLNTGITECTFKESFLVFFPSIHCDVFCCKHKNISQVVKNREEKMERNLNPAFFLTHFPLQLSYFHPQLTIMIMKWMS